MLSPSQRAKKSILIVTQAFDPHADELIVLLRYMGQEPIRLNTEAIPTDSLLSYTFARGVASLKLDDIEQGDTVQGEPGRYTLFIDGRQIEARFVQSIWWRRPAPYRFGGTLEPEELRIATEETEQAVQSFCLALSAQGCYWISSPAALALARNLPEQLRRAHSYGFATPRSLLTTRVGHVRTFYQETGGHMVYRMLSSLVTGMQNGARSALVTEELLAAFEGTVTVPSLFYEQLSAKRFFLAVVIGDQVFAAQTTGGEEEITHWWSPQIAELSYEPAPLPDRIIDRCRTFAHSYGLEFAVIQLALSADDQLFFVSLDPAGSFMWLEQQCPDLRMSEALAQRLIDGTGAAQ